MTIITCKSGTEINLEAGIKYDVDPELAEAINIYIDQFRARVAELEGVLRVIKEPEDAATWLLRDHALNRTSRQSLAKVKAETLRKLAASLVTTDYWGDELIIDKESILDEADRIEQEG